MPKIKTSKTALKRFKITSKGTLLQRKATRAHKLLGKSARRKRAFTKDHATHATNVAAVKKMLGI